MTPTPVPRNTSSILSRRTLLAGAGGALLLVACGQKDATGTSPGTTPKATGVNLFGQFDANDYAVSGIPQRLVVALLDNSGQPPKSATETIEVTVMKDGKAVAPAISVGARQNGVPAPYYPVPFTFNEPGMYSLVTTVRGATSPVAFKVSDPKSLPLIQMGQKMPVVDSPTIADARGVDPICTRSSGMCALHTLNLRDALATGQPTAVLMSTPAFCQIGVCGPVLENLLALRSSYAKVQFIHCEVYQKPKATAGNPSAGGIAPVLQAFGLNYEPSLFLASGDGTVVTRLDNVFDKGEMKEGLDRLANS